MNPESINNFVHVKKILSLEFNRIMKDKDKDEACRDYYVNLIVAIDKIRANIDIANDPAGYIQIKKRCNPDGNVIK